MQDAWLKYLRASGYAVRQYKRGPFRYRLQPKSDLRRAAALGWFASEQDLIAHLRDMAGHDLRRDAQMHMDSAYAVVFGDPAFMGEQTLDWVAADDGLTRFGEDPLEAHRQHTAHVKACAQRFLPPTARDLTHAVRLHREFRCRDTAAQYRCRWDQARAWFEAKTLSDALTFNRESARIGLWHRDGVTGINHLRLGEERLVAILPPKHPLTGGKSLTLERLATLPLVDYPQESSARRQTDKAFAAVGIVPQIHFEVNHVELIAQFVAQGLAASLVPESVTSRLRDVVPIPVRDAPKRVLYAVWTKVPTPAAVAFIDLLGKTSTAHADPATL